MYMRVGAVDSDGRGCADLPVSVTGRAELAEIVFVEVQHRNSRDFPSSPLATYSRPFEVPRDIYRKREAPAAQGAMTRQSS